MLPKQHQRKVELVWKQLGDQSCVDIEAIDSGKQLACTGTSVTNTTSSKDIVLCSTNVVCIVDNKILHRNRIDVEWRLGQLV